MNKKTEKKRKRSEPVDGSPGYEEDDGTLANELRELLADATPEDVGRALLRPMRRSS